MALTKQKKHEIVDEIGQILATSKMIVMAGYGGTTVGNMQELRRQSADRDTQVKIIKNRLFKRALEADDKFKNTGRDLIKGQLLYAYSSTDEVAPAQSLAQFAKTQPQITLIGAITADGQILDAQDVKALANLPSKLQLQAQLAATAAAPLSNFAAVLQANLRSLINVLDAKAKLT